VRPSSEPSVIPTPPARYAGQPHLQLAWFAGRRDAKDGVTVCPFDAEDSRAAWRDGWESIQTG
jgi:hypothetical protein